MTNSNKLKGRIVEKGYNLSTFALSVGISRPSLRGKLNGTVDFRASEIEKVCSLLNISRSEIGDYFFTAKVPVLETDS